MKIMSKGKLIGVLVVALGCFAHVAVAEERSGEIVQLVEDWGKVLDVNAGVQREAAIQKSAVAAEIESIAKRIQVSTDERIKPEDRTKLLSLYEEKNRIQMDQVDGTQSVVWQGIGVLRDMIAVMDKNEAERESVDVRELKFNQVLTAAHAILSTDALTDEQRAQVETTVLLSDQLYEMQNVKGVGSKEIRDTLKQFEDTMVQLEVVKKLLVNQRKVLTVQAHRQCIAAAMNKLAEFNGGAGITSVVVDMADSINADMANLHLTTPEFEKQTITRSRSRGQATSDVFTKRNVGR